MPTYLVVARYAEDHHIQPCPGNAIHLSQLVAALEERFHLPAGSLRLYAGTNQLHPLCSTEDLKAELHRLPRGASLTVHCVRRNGIHDDVELTDISDHTTLALLKRFARHRVTCYHSGQTPLRGVIYEYVHSHSIVLSKRCYERLGADARRKWRKRALPRHWASDAPPPASNSADDVRHLQYLLTRMGYMSTVDTDRRTGIYGHHTAAAVESFRIRHHIYGGDLTVYNHSTGKKLAEVVRAYRQRGHRYM